MKNIILLCAIICCANGCWTTNRNIDDSVHETSDIEEFPIWEGPCGSDDAPEKLSQCKRVLAAWAIGAGPFVYPKV